jgi:hypothetical protein
MTKSNFTKEQNDLIIQYAEKHKFREINSELMQALRTMGCMTTEKQLENRFMDMRKVINKNNRLKGVGKTTKKYSIIHDDVHNHDVLVMNSRADEKTEDSLEHYSPVNINLNETQFNGNVGVKKREISEQERIMIDSILEKTKEARELFLPGLPYCVCEELLRVFNHDGLCTLSGNNTTPLKFSDIIIDQHVKQDQKGVIYCLALELTAPDFWRLNDLVSSIGHDTEKNQFKEAAGVVAASAHTNTIQFNYIGSTCKSVTERYNMHIGQYHLGIVFDRVMKIICDNGIEHRIIRHPILDVSHLMRTQWEQLELFYSIVCGMKKNPFSMNHNVYVTKNMQFLNIKTIVSRGETSGELKNQLMKMGFNPPEIFIDDFELSELVCKVWNLVKLIEGRNGQILHHPRKRYSASTNGFQHQLSIPDNFDFSGTTVKFMLRKSMGFLVIAAQINHGEPKVIHRCSDGFMQHFQTIKANFSKHLDIHPNSRHSKLCLDVPDIDCFCIPLFGTNIADHLSIVKTMKTTNKYMVFYLPFPSKYGGCDEVHFLIEGGALYFKYYKNGHQVAKAKPGKATQLAFKQYYEIGRDMFGLPEQNLITGSIKQETLKRKHERKEKSSKRTKL